MSLSDSHSAYSRKTPSYNAKLTEVGRGTPMGELLRRYWHPVGVSADAGATPRPVKVLGEELILFRDGEGRPGLVYPRCCHRGTTLYYGKIEERGIRCCYHGWLFDVEGHCLEMPCEPNPTGPQCQRVRQPWYPVEERYGLVFAYLGPPEKKPVLPRYECLEVMGAGEFVEADDSSIGSGGIVIAPLPWLHIAEVAAQHAVERGYRRIGITGTKWLVDSEVYPEKFAARGLQYVKPSPAERDECNRIIMDELVRSQFTPQGVACFQQVIARMKDQGCDAVVLGCTEIPLIINDANSALPTLDSTRLLARAALRRAVDGKALAA